MEAFKAFFVPFYGVWLVLSVLLLCGGGGSWQTPSCEQRLRFRSPGISSIASVNLGLWLLSSPLLYVATGAFSPGSYAPGDGPLLYFLAFLYFGIAYALVAVIWWASAPQETEVDLERRTCVHTRGWCWRRKTWVFSLDEVSALHISHLNSVYLGTKLAERPPSQVMLAGSFGGNPNSLQRGQARRFAEKISAILNVPVVEDPTRYNY
ncbi:MAG: hypothetical protein JO250_08050 [Armatimonadetes bacterium]|nr:hypothetical protein [Armatimonadota bacterium]